jgi:SAM-dependent methyltransferase
MQGHKTLEARWFENLPDSLRGYVEGEAGEKLLMTLPHLTHPDLAQIPSFARLNENADDFFELLNLLDIRPGEVILEIGAHMGWAAHHLVVRGANVIAMDISHQLKLTDVFIKNGIPMERVYADMMNLPAQKNSLDMIFGVATIHHAEDLEKLFAACARSLRAGGACVFFSEPVAGMDDVEAKESFGAEEKELGIQEHIYTIEEYFSAAKKAGLSPRVIPLPGILRESHRRYKVFRFLWLILLKSKIGYRTIFTRRIYPFMLRFYPRIPFPHLALVLKK